MIAYFTKTSIGYSHIKENKCCQDYSACYHDEERTIITACDGHGGDLYVRSHLGSKFASEAVIKVLKELERGDFYKYSRKDIRNNLRLKILCEWNAMVERDLSRKYITKREVAHLNEDRFFRVKQNPEKAYGTTLNAAMILGTKLICVSIGDGGCFLVKSGQCISPFPEDDDEPVANITYSLCQDDAFSHLQVSVHELSAYDGAVVCTDGMINPYQNLSNFSTGLIAPAIMNLYLGKFEQLSAFVSEVGTKLGTGDDVSLGILVKGKVSIRAYSKAKGI